MKTRNHKWPACILALYACPALAEPTFKQELYIGYSSEKNTVVQAQISATDKLEVGLGTLTLEGRLRYRSDQDTLDYVDDDIADIRLSYDMGRAGTLTFTTFSKFKGYPWIDGEIMDRGSRAVFPSVSPLYRNVGGISALRYNGENIRADEDYYFEYTNRWGKTGLIARFTPYQKYGPVSGDDVRKPDGSKLPMAELILDYQLERIGLRTGINDLKDIYYLASIKELVAGLKIDIGQQIREADYDDHQTLIGITYAPEGFKYFKRALVAYTVDRELESGVLSLWFGDGAWQAGFAVDTDGDLAAEASYDIAENATLVAGWDSGFADGEGFDPGKFPQFDPEPRGSALEIGLNFRF